MSTQLKDREESQTPDGECQPQSTTWSEEARDNPAIMKLVMEEFVEEKSSIPLAVLALVDTILTLFVGLTVLKEHKKKFAHIVADACALVAIIRKLELYKNSTGSLSEYIAGLNQTMSSVNKLLTTKGKRNFAKRKIFILLDLAKLKKYQERLNSLAEDLGQESQNVKITQILADVIKEKIRSRPHDICPQEIIYTAEPEVEEDSVQAPRRQVVRLSQTTQIERERRGSDLARVVSARSPRRGRAPLRSGTQRSPTRQSESRSTISGFSFSNGTGTMTNSGIGNIHTFD